MADEMEQDAHHTEEFHTAKPGEAETEAEETLVVEAAADPEIVVAAETVGGDEAAGGAAAVAPVNENFKWYIIHAYSGFERTASKLTAAGSPPSWLMISTVLRSARSRGR